MRKLLVLLSALGLAGTLCPADSFTGTWKLDAAKSKFECGPAPKEITMMERKEGSITDMTVTETDGSGKAYSNTLDVSDQWRPGQVPGRETPTDGSHLWRKASQCKYPPCDGHAGRQGNLDGGDHSQRRRQGDAVSEERSASQRQAVVYRRSDVRKAVAVERFLLAARRCNQNEAEGVRRLVRPANARRLSSPMPSSK